MPLSESILLIMILLSIAMLAAGLFRNMSIPFQDFSDVALNALASKVQRVTFLPDDVIIAENDKGSSLYIIKSGIARVEKSGIDPAHPLPALKSGEFIGEIALLGEHVRTASVIAQTTVITYRLRREDVSQLSLEHPEIAQRLQHERNKRL